MKTKLSTVFAVTALALSISGQVSAKSIQIGSDAQDYQETKVEMLKRIEMKLHKASPSLINYPLTLDPISSQFAEETGSRYTPVVFTGRSFLMDDEGTMFDPKYTFIIGEKGIGLASNKLISLEMKNRNWPSHEVNKDVTKKGDVYVLTDPTCGYCHEVEKEIDTYTANGLEVHLVPYPRSGVASLDSAGMGRWAAAACSEEPAKAYREISLGNLDKYATPTDINAECVDIIREGYKLGQKIGIGGTPFMFGENLDGDVYSQPGYIAVDKFASAMGILIKPDGSQNILNK